MSCKACATSCELTPKGTEANSSVRCVRPTSTSVCERRLDELPSAAETSTSVSPLVFIVASTSTGAETTETTAYARGGNGGGEDGDGGLGSSGEGRNGVFGDAPPSKPTARRASTARILCGGTTSLSTVRIRSAAADAASDSVAASAIKVCVMMTIA